MRAAWTARHRRLRRRACCRPPPNLPPNVERLLADPAYFAAENLLTLRNTRIANMLGLCALTLPTGIPSCGLMAMAAARRRGAAPPDRRRAGAALA